MTVPEVELRRAWRRLAGNHHDHLLEHLLAMHRDPARQYHGLTHVMWVLRHVDDLLRVTDRGSGATIDGESVDGDAVDGDAVRLAALCHDAVYDPTRSDNEARSADLAARVAGDLGWSDDRCATVHRLVMATAAHAPTGADEAVLVDADLAVLGSSPAEYDAYVHGVRREYTHVDDASWRVGRAAVLQRFLDAPYVYSTPFMRNAREARARANLTSELAELSRAR